MVLIPHTPIEQVDPPKSPKETLPTMYDLPSEDPEEPGLPDEFHDLQPQLLSRTLRLTDYSRENCFTASGLNLYYDVKHPLWHKRPDWFLVVNVPRLYEGTDLRRSYVSWQEGQHPYVVVEFLSPGTESEDLGRFYNESSNKADDVDRVEEIETTRLTRQNPPSKFEVYEEYLRVPHYIIYSRYTQQLRHFKLDGGRYLEQSQNSNNPRIWLADLKIGLGIWSGVFEDVPSHWLRWCDREGNWLLTDTEQAQAQLRQAAQNLLATGMEVSQIAEILCLSAEQVQAFFQREMH
ncbi:Uma2 family endonuclease [Microseira sp. BLCC-F43]|jgi:Uma2 family endonuclease|uniref:Uma2 family endonuclease n=1 Tax=Microseira sp. BLCC-F43 TaxID=3153602 RepID=UPI0035B967AB